jgi:hypothetical protein
MERQLENGTNIFQQEVMSKKRTGVRHKEGFKKHVRAQNSAEEGDSKRR